MILRPRKLLILGGTLIVIALLTMAIASLYVWLAPKTYSAQVMISIQTAPPNAAPIRPENLPLGSLRYDRNIAIEVPRNSSIFTIRAFASTPGAAVEHADKSARELEAQVRRSLKADVSIIESATANPRPVRPKKQAIFASSGLIALNLALVGGVVFLVAWMKARRSSLPEPSAPTRLAT